MNCSYAVEVPLPIEPQRNEKNWSKKKMSAHHWFRTTPFKAKAGLKQGRNLSLLLANIFLSDLHQAPEKEHVCAPQLIKHRVTSISRADDFLIMSPSASGLQKCKENLEQLAKQWGLVVSMEKTRCVIFSIITCYALFLKSDWLVALLFLLK